MTQVASGLTGTTTDIENAGDGSGRMFIVSQPGIIRILRNGSFLSQPFLDIQSRIKSGGEQGLLGLAFPPGFATKQRFYVDYTDVNGDTVIAQYRVTANPDVADPSSEIILLHITQPFPNHNGGQVRFGPDGYLYIGMGDGGGGGDPNGNGQSLGTLLGKLLRIDVESNPGQVVIPPDNPFANRAGARPEIWAYGLRNPWRFSFDSANGDLWIGDVGQDLYEEVDFAAAGSGGGQDYGWNVMEGLHCYKPASGCSTQGLTLPVAEYSHADGSCSITGGFVYRGRVSPGLQGTYLYTDFCTGKIWGIQRQNGQFVSQLLLASGRSITTFGVDEAGEIYLDDANAGSIFHVTGGQAPQFVSSQVVNAASFVPGLTPGSLATVFATGVLDDPGIVSAPSIPLPSSLNNVSVSVGGVAAPVLAVTNRNGQEQVNFQVPFEIAGRQSVGLTVSRSGRTSASATVAVTDPEPAIYTSNGTDAIAVHNAGFSLSNSASPLTRGEYAFLYASGLGAVANQPATGSAAPLDGSAVTRTAVTATIGGVPCDVQFAGLAPGFVGVYQVNFRVADGVPSGIQDLVIHSGGVDSPTVHVYVR